MDQTVQDTLAEAFDAAPPYVQDYVRSGKYEEFLDSLRVLGDFHVDTMQIVSDELLMMLLGMTEPRELPISLKQQAGLTDEEVEMIIDYANDEIFAPVREAALAPAQASSAPAAPLVGAPQIGQPAPVAPVAVPGYAPDPTRPSEPAPSYAPPIPVPPPAPVATVPLTPTPPPAPVPAYVPPPEPIAPPVRTMARDVEGLERGVAPSSWPAPTPVPSAPIPVPQMPVAAPSSLPTPVRPPVPPFPTPPVAAPLPSSQPPVSPAPSSAPVPPRAPDYAEVSATLKQYGIDPYREAVE